MPVKYIEKDDLKELLKAKKPASASSSDPQTDNQKSLLIVDVRDDDHKGGHIPGSLHVPSETFEAAVDNLVKGKARDVGTVVFHCSYSQQRGPKTARIYSETREAHSAKESLPPQEILILRGGFSEWQAVYREDPYLVEKWDKKVWGTGSTLSFWSS